LIIALILLERCSDKTALKITRTTWRITLLAALIVSSKVVFDEKVYLQDYRDVLTSLELHVVSKQETAFLELLGYRTVVRRAQYAKYYFALLDVHEAICGHDARDM